MVTHDPHAAERADRILHLEKGVLVEQVVRGEAMTFLPFILRNALRSKRRTILTVLSIVVSLFLFCTIRTVLTSFDPSLRMSGAARLVIRRSTSLTFFLPLSYKDRLAQIPGVER